MTDLKAKRFQEIIAIMDDQTWIWSFVSLQLSGMNLEHLRLPSDIPIRGSWERFKDAALMIIHWESKLRSGGAIVEEILDIQPNFDVGERIIVVTTNPTHEDVVYFSELGVRNIITLRNRDKELTKATHDFEALVRAQGKHDRTEQAWRELLHEIDTLPLGEVTEERLSKLEADILRLRPNEDSARYLDAVASLMALRQNHEAAVRYWHDAFDKNPNYYRTYNNLIKFYRLRGNHVDAMKLMQKMHELNKSNIARLVGMGETQMALGDVKKAEFYFQTALDRDRYSSGALNGLAEIRFHEGKFEESRQLLARSNLAFKAAQRLNQQGIDLVRKERYEAALEHYTNAQFVLPQQEKGPLLFYNIGLCYSRWGKLDMAQRFLQIALIKDPTYQKAQKLLAVVEERITQEQAA